MKCLLLLLAVTAIVQAAKDGPHPVATLQVAKTDLYRQIVDAAGVTSQFSNDKARITVLAPTDEAVKAFLKDMGLTMDDIKKNPRLAKDIVAYHTILGAAGPKELFAKGDTVDVATFDPHYKLIIKKKGDGVYIRDAQGNEAKVAKASLGGADAKHTVHTIDKVLYSGSYFKDLAAVVKLFPGMFSDVAAVAKKAGMADTLTTQKFADTIFLPTNAAFKKAKVSVDKADKATLENVLKYHAVAGVRTIPDGFAAGKPVETLLKGQAITVTYKDEGKHATTGLATRRAHVTDGTGHTAMIIKPNVIVGKAVAHVIDGVLTPKSSSQAVATESAHKQVSKDSKATGRKLLQGGPGGRNVYVPTIAMDSAEQAIQAAVNSGASSSATKAAAKANLSDAQVEVMFPEHATYADGVRGSVAALASGGN